MQYCSVEHRTVLPLPVTSATRCESNYILRYFDVKNRISNVLDFYEDLNETTNNIKQKLVDILFDCKLDLAYLSAYWEQFKCKF